MCGIVDDNDKDDNVDDDNDNESFSHFGGTNERVQLLLLQRRTAVADAVLSTSSSPLTKIKRKGGQPVVGSRCAGLGLFIQC